MGSVEIATLNKPSPPAMWMANSGIPVTRPDHSTTGMWNRKDNKHQQSAMYARSTACGKPLASMMQRGKPPKATM